MEIYLRLEDMIGHPTRCMFVMKCEAGTSTRGIFEECNANMQVRYACIATNLHAKSENLTGRRLSAAGT